MLTTEWGDFGGDGWMGRSHAEPPGFTTPPHLGEQGYWGQEVD